LSSLKNPVAPVGTSSNVVGFSGEILVITRFPNVHDAAFAAVVNPSEATQAANNSFFIATAKRDCGIQPELTYRKGDGDFYLDQSSGVVADGKQRISPVTSQASCARAPGTAPMGRTEAAQSNRADGSPNFSVAADYDRERG